MTNILDGIKPKIVTMDSQYYSIVDTVRILIRKLNDSGYNSYLTDKHRDKIHDEIKRLGDIKRCEKCNKETIDLVVVYPRDKSLAVCDECFIGGMMPQ